MADEESNFDPGEFFLNDFRDDAPRTTGHFSRLTNAPFTVVGDDTFFRLLYDYHQGSGFVCILLTNVCHLLSVIFMIIFSSFIVTCVDWKSIHDGEKDTLLSAIYPMCKPPEGRNGYFVFGFIVFTLWWLIETVRTIFYLLKIKRVHEFWIGVLGLSSDVQWVTWQMVIDSYHERVNSSVDSHYIVSRIMRWDNYLIAMLTKNIFGLEEWNGMFTKVLEWSLERAIKSALFRDDGIMIKDVILEGKRFEYVQRLRKSFIIYGVLGLLFAPFVITAMSVKFIYQYVGEYHKNPKAMGVYSFTPVSRWKLRDFNELSHVYTERLNRAHPKIIEYLGQFVNESYNIISKFLSFLLGSMLLIFVIVSFFNPDIIISLFITEKPVIFYVSVTSALFMVFKNNTIEQPFVYEPDEKFYELVKILHCTPSSWANMSTRERYLEIRRLFRYKWIVFLQEILSVIYVPFILLLWLPRQSDQIVNFFRENSVRVDQLGIVCSCAMFDKNQQLVHADADDEDLNSVSGSMERSNRSLHSSSSIERKITSSALNFAQAYPTWDPVRFKRNAMTHFAINREYEERLRTMRQRKEQSQQNQQQNNENQDRYQYRQQYQQHHQQQRYEQQQSLLSSRLEHSPLPGSFSYEPSSFPRSGSSISPVTHMGGQNQIASENLTNPILENTDLYHSAVEEGSSHGTSFDMNLPFQMHLSE